MDRRVPPFQVLLDFSGDNTAGETPLPIPNRAVKPRRADGTIWATVWESRSLPGVIDESPVLELRVGLSSVYAGREHSPGGEGPLRPVLEIR